MRLQNKVILVTASTRGIGRAIVEACAAEGAQVYLAARNPQRGQAAAEELSRKGLRVKWVYNDAADGDSFRSMVEETVADAGHIDGLVNNFGASDPRKDRNFRQTEPEVFLNTVTTNLRSVFLASQAALPHMPAGSSIVNISSVGGLVPDISQVAYGTSKAAINYLTRLIALHEAASGIRCNAILPGMTATEAVEGRLSEDFRRSFLRHIPLGRMGQPEEIAAAAVYLLSDESAYTTGQLLTISGGFGLGTPLYGDFAGKSRGQ